MIADIIVTTPKSEMKNSAAEAQAAQRQGGDTCYFRALASAPKGLAVGVSRVFYVEDGYVRGFAVVDCAHTDAHHYCDVTGRDWFGRCTLVMRANSWKWIKPIQMRGFQGWRYFDEPIEIVGNWRDPKPLIVPEPPAERILETAR